MEDSDAEELLARFFAHNNVAIGDFDLNRYFPAEGLGLIAFRRKAPDPVPLTLGMLLHAARLGVWRTAEIEAAARR